MNFDEEVLVKSQEKPVVVDFWAPWCGPCKVLGPVIEELAEGQDKWELVKINSDDHPELSSRYRIKGIPAVKMFFQGDVIAEFTGALPKIQVEAWLSDNLPDERKKQLANLKSRHESGEAVTEQLEELVRHNPDLPEASLWLAELLVFSETSKAQAIISSMRNSHKFLDQLEDLKSLIDFMECPLEDSPLGEKILQSREKATKGDFDAVLEQLIEVVMTDKSFCNEMPRRATIALFHQLGEQHELTKKYRRRFDMALY